MANIEHFIEIGIALSSEKNHDALLEKVLKSAMELANADGGTIYSIAAENELVFKTLINQTLQIHLGGTSKDEIPYPNIPILKYGKHNNSAIVAISAATKKVINIDDAYACHDFDLSAAKAMDKKMNYHTKSVLTLPMNNHHDDLNGVIQLINAKNDKGHVIAFTPEVERVTSALTSLAGMIITNKELVDDMENLFNSFSQLIASAIDKKSPYTGGHCRRVPEITMMLARACHRIDSGELQGFSMSEDDFNELSVAAWLHDCGKVATPEYVMDKAKKLETICDRITLVDARFEIAARDIYNSQTLDQKEKIEQLKQLESDREFIKIANTGGEFFDDEKIQRVYQIGKSYQVSIANTKQSVLSDDEIYNLITKRGTLNAKERQIINSHMDVTVEMLEAMPFPKHLQRVPEYACGHHEKMDGTGYPKGLKREQMSIPARMMAIADIFEALTANDRPYKAPKKLSETLMIMGRMRLEDHLDPDLFMVFIKEKVYLEFAQQALDKSQLDEFDINQIPGCQTH
ncbi:MAG: HD-GYP domain-containing protein (c-di-GMP phosphodiesterase class II) [Alteromonadaceae bacterium]|jgi:HD-GYP domain-containing protein (c-di-GMP phosphodiesterase class II)